MRSQQPPEPGRLATVTIPGEDVAALAMLADAPGTLAQLQRARTSRNLAFLAAVLESGGDGPGRRMAQAGFEALIAVQRRRPDVVREVLQHPRFGAWAAFCAADLGAGGADRCADDGSIAHLASFAAAAAMRAGVECELEVPQIGDAVVVPGLGCWSGRAGNSARVQLGRSAISPQDGRRWTGIRRLSARLPGAPITVEFDDLPPTPAAWPENAPVPADSSWKPWEHAEFRTWQRLFDVALPLLHDVVPELAAPMCQGIRAIIPRAPVSSRFVTSTLVDSFGAAAMILPADAVSAASGLLHEFQHSKLSVLMELVPLITDDGPADLPSPWRAEPRPASAVLHGAYAHAAVARFLLRASRFGVIERARDGARVRQEALDACHTLLDSPRLTPTGRRFVETLRHTVTPDIQHPTSTASRPC